jgi:thiamine-phosphate pyrophosphorylase
MDTVRIITGGLYLVVDPAKGAAQVLPAVHKAIAGGVDIIQVWNHWYHGQDKPAFIEQVCNLAHAQNIPVLINEEWQLINNTALDGVHLDDIPNDIANLRQQVHRPFIIGITCGNDLYKVQWAIENNLHYISFCSMFSSSSANSCELVKPETVQAARQLTTMPIFLAGGITPENIEALAETDMNGIAVIGGIMSAPDPQQKAQRYKQALYNIKQIKQ